MLLERLRRFLSVIASHCVHDDPTNQSHLRPYVRGSASEAKFNEETRR